MIKLMRKYKDEICLINLIYYVFYLIIKGSKGIWWQCLLLCLLVTITATLYSYIKEKECV